MHGLCMVRVLYVYDLCMVRVLSVYGPCMVCVCSEYGPYMVRGMVRVWSVNCVLVYLVRSGLDSNPCARCALTVLSARGRVPYVGF